MVSYPIRIEPRVYAQQRVPVGSITFFASLLDALLTEVPAFCAVYIRARARGDDEATRVLWAQVRREPVPVPEVWEELKRGVIRQPEAARHVLLALVLSDGWRRIKVCEVEGCSRAFADATNGALRRRCAAHAHHRDHADAIGPQSPRRP